MPRSELSILLVASIVVSGCDSTSPRVTAQAHARFVNGATPRPAGTGATLTVAAAPPGNGTWLLSPDKITLKLKRIFFAGDGGSGSQQDVNCTIVYDKSKPGLSQLADCPFVLDTGTCNRVTVFFESPYDLFIDDATNGFFTTSNGIVTTAPAGGAQTFSFTVPNATDNEWAPSPIELPAPVVVTEATPVTLNVVINGLQFFRAAVTAGTVSTAATTPQRPGLVATIGNLAAVEFYSHPAIATAQSYCAFNCGSSSPNGVTSVSLYYTSATTPVEADVALNGPPACMNGAVISIIHGQKSYIGLDGAGNLGWALPTDLTYTTYASEMRMSRAATVGSTTTLYCKARSTDPSPPGGSYASGAPAINQPGNSLGNYVLVAK